MFRMLHTAFAAAWKRLISKRIKVVLNKMIQMANGQVTQSQLTFIWGPLWSQLSLGSKDIVSNLLWFHS